MIRGQTVLSRLTFVLLAVSALSAIVLFLRSGLLYADIIYLKNGQIAEGIITEENNQGIELNLGDTTVLFGKKEIGRVEKSGPEEISAIEQQWAQKRRKAVALNAINEEKRRKLMDEWRENNAREEAFRREGEQKRRRMDANTRRVPVTVNGNGHIVADVTINGGYRASLVVDTGSPIVLLTAGLARQLGYNTDETGDTAEIMVLNGKHKGRHVSLDSLTLGDAVERNVRAFVLFDDDREVNVNFGDGLLGLSFLSRFHLSFDPEKGQLLLRKD